MSHNAWLSKNVGAKLLFDWILSSDIPLDFHGSMGVVPVKVASSVNVILVVLSSNTCVGPSPRIKVSFR